MHYAINHEPFSFGLLPCISSLIGKLNHDGGGGGILKTNKVVRLDGLPREFYCKFWGWIGKDLVQIFKEIMEAGEVGECFADGVVIQLYKKGGRESLKNW